MKDQNYMTQHLHTCFAKPQNRKAAVIYFTDNGKVLSKKLTDKVDGQYIIFNKKNETVKEFLQKEFSNNDAIIFIGAVGIAVRLIKDLIISKDIDPAVIVIDELGRYIIPILSGHIGKGNEIANIIATSIGAVAVITTATDINNKFSVDTFFYNRNCVIVNLADIKNISAKILKNEPVSFYSDFLIENNIPEEINYTDSDTGIVVSLDDNKKFFLKTLNVVPKIVTIGVGCKRDIDEVVFENFLLDTLKKRNISILAVDKISSIDLKKDEECIISFSKKYNIPFTTLSKEELNNVKGDFSKSEFVQSITGVDCVCERSAMRFSDKVTKKIAYKGMTISIGTKDWKCEF